MTRSELATILTEIEGQRRALVDHGFHHTADVLQNTMGKLVVEHITDVITALKFWDVPLAITKEMVEETVGEVGKRKPPQPTDEQLKDLKWQ